MSGAVRRRLLIASLVFFVAILGAAIDLLLQIRPQILPEPAGLAIDCVSYAPFRRHGESPLEPDTFVSPERIHADLQQLSAYTDCVRTYSVDQGLEAVPAIAAMLGQRVLLGIWIDRDTESNQTEIARALALAQVYPQTVSAIIVGNEVLLRQELSAGQLGKLIRQVRAGTEVPVTYADVWEFWLRNDELAELVDWVTVHILPYWEDEPVAVERAASYVMQVQRQVEAAFPGREILIGETGWPSVGRMRGAAMPGRVEQARFTREWVALATELGVSYNLIEAFDQPWKRRLEGAMGGSWGFLDSDAERKYPWSGPVAQRDRLPWSAVASASIGAVLFLVCYRVMVSPSLRRMVGWPLGLNVVLVGGLSGLLLPSQWQYLSHWSRNTVEWLAGGTLVLLGLSAAFLLPLVLANNSLARKYAGLMSIWNRVCLAVIFTATLFVLMHLFNGRYLGYAFPLWILPALVLFLSRLLGLGQTVYALRERLLGLIILTALPWILWPEMPDNTQALIFALLMMAVAWSALSPAFVSSSKPDSTAKAPGAVA